MSVMEQRKEEVLEMSDMLDGFVPVSSPPLLRKSRIKPVDEAPNKEERAQNKEEGTPLIDEKMEEPSPELSERRKALFEPLEPIMNANGKRASAECLLPPPDFETASYPRGWLVGKKRKLVNVDVVESMRRIAVQEMNRKMYQSFMNSHVNFGSLAGLALLQRTRPPPQAAFPVHELKDREIDGLNEQLEEDSRCLEHLQIQLLQEKSKRCEVERDNAMLQDQISMLMDMLQQNEEEQATDHDQP